MKEFPTMTFHLNDNYFDRINRMLRQAYYHGGDAGGPYQSNFKGLAKEMLDFLTFVGGDYVIVKDVDGCLQFAKLYKQEATE